MKILCETSIRSRLDSSQQGSAASRPQKSTLAIGMHPPGKNNAELFIIVFTSRHKTGIRYKVTENIGKVFTKFVHDGKATISFKLPAVDLVIQCDAVQLKCFLQTLKLGLEKKAEMNKLGLTTLAATAIPLSAHPPTKMTIKSRTEFPTKPLPRTLKSLCINETLTKFNTNILFLKHLQYLDLSKNSMEMIPKQLGELQLVEVDLSANKLGNNFVSPEYFKWLTAAPIQQSLKSLNLSNNNIKAFPYRLVKLQRIVTLKLDHNEIENIPFAIRRMKGLRFLHISNNKLSSLPSNINRIPFSLLDISGNLFSSNNLAELNSNRNKMLTNYAFMQEVHAVDKLWELAGRVVLRNKLPYSPATLPFILVDILEETPLCACGKLCFCRPIYRKSIVLNMKSELLISSHNVNVYGNVVYCSRRCALNLK